MNPDKISNDKTVEINLQPSTYFSLTWQGSRVSLERQKWGEGVVFEQQNRRPKGKGRFLEPRLKLHQASDPMRWSIPKKLETQK